MGIKVLVIEEREEDDKLLDFNEFVACSVIMGYEYHICHKYKEIPQALETFNPNIVFFIVERFTHHVTDYINTIRQFSQKTSVILASEMDFGSRGKSLADFYLNSTGVLPNVFQKVITEQLFTNLYDDSSLVKEVKLDMFDGLSDNALRAIAAEQMWEAKEWYLERLLKRKSEGKTLHREDQEIFEKYMRRRELLLQRKAKAAEILIARGCTETAEQLMNPED